MYGGSKLTETARALQQVEGKTGQPLVDANMRELKLTGVPQYPPQHGLCCCVLLGCVALSDAIVHRCCKQGSCRTEDVRTWRRISPRILMSTGDLAQPTSKSALTPGLVFSGPDRPRGDCELGELERSCRRDRVSQQHALL
eukprot:3941604-Rhodomonas_salina.6